MRKIILLLVFILLSSFIYSQDTINKKCSLKYLLNGVAYVTLKRTTLESTQFIIRGDNKDKEEMVRVTFQDIENGSHRKVLFQENNVGLNDEFYISIPKNLIEKTSLVFLQVLKGSNTFYLKINITD